LPLPLGRRLGNIRAFPPSRRTQRRRRLHSRLPACIHIIGPYMISEFSDRRHTQPTPRAPIRTRARMPGSGGYASVCSRPSHHVLQTAVCPLDHALLSWPSPTDWPATTPPHSPAQFSDFVQTLSAHFSGCIFFCFTRMW
jgi:hypothetical protein